MFSLVLFLGCASFVAHRGYACFLKYLEKPQAIDVAFKSSASQDAFFPLITFCSWNIPLKENILKECNLTADDYLEKNMWVGQGHANCTDPKVLKDQIFYGLDNLWQEIVQFSVVTYGKSQQDGYVMYANDTRLQWTSFNQDGSSCHTMTLPVTMVESGIWYFDIYFESIPSLVLFWHEYGLFRTDMPDSCRAVIVNKNGSGYQIPIGHETLELLEYDGENCEKSKDYKLDRCRHEVIEKVNSSTY